MKPHNVVHCHALLTRYPYQMYTAAGHQLLKMEKELNRLHQQKQSCTSPVVIFQTRSVESAEPVYICKKDTSLTVIA